MTQEIKTTALFEGYRKGRWKKGDALRITLTGAKTLEGFTESFIRQHSRPTKLPKSHLGLFKESVLGGFNYWILISTLLSGDSHNEWVSFYEGDTHSTMWIGDCLPRITFLKTSPFRYEMRLSKKSIHKLCTTIEFPRRDWLNSRLIPRRHPAAIRTMPNKVIQMWINL